LSRFVASCASQHLRQIIWTEVRDVVTRVRPDADHTFAWSYSQLYVSATAMTIPCLADRRRDVPSVYRLIAERRAPPRCADAEALPRARTR
jgi:hypothetical protein